MVALIDKTSNGFNFCHHQNFWPSTVILYSRGSQTGVHLPICRVHLLYIYNKLNYENGVYLYSYKVLKVQINAKMLLNF